MTRDEYRQAILGFPDQFSVGLEAGEGGAVRRGAHDRVVVCGMGGSALGAELLGAWLDTAPDISVHRDYDLPNDVTARTLVVCVSYSGDTEETVSAAEAAVKAGRSLVVVTTGGKLAALAGKHAVPVVALPKGMPPRLSVGAQFGALYAVLGRAGVMEYDEAAVIAAAAEIAQVKDIEARGIKIAAAIGDRIPLVYSSTRNGAVARNWKIKLNETAKVQAFWSVLPEADHNEINAFPDGAERFCFLALTDEADHPRVQKRLALTSDIAAKQGSAHVTVPLTGGERLERLLYGLWLGDFVALALADARKADPAGTPIIDELKKALTR